MTCEHSHYHRPQQVQAERTEGAGTAGKDLAQVHSALRNLVNNTQGLINPHEKCLGQVSLDAELPDRWTFLRYVERECRPSYLFIKCNWQGVSRFHTEINFACCIHFQIVRFGERVPRIPMIIKHKKNIVKRKTHLVRRKIHLQNALQLLKYNP